MFLQVIWHAEINYIACKKKNMLIVVCSCVASVYMH